MKKDNFWQMIRGICIILVILIHTLYSTNDISINYINIIFRRIINFCTPTFIFIAGFFTNIKNEKDFYKKKINRIIIPLIIWDLIYGFIKIINSDLSFIEILKTFILSNSPGLLYYLYVLLQMFLIAPFMIKYINHSVNSYRKYLPLLISPLFCLFLTFFYIYTNKSFLLYNYWIFGWVSYYYLGLLLKDSKMLKSNKNMLLCLVLCLSSIIMGIIIYIKFNIYELAISQLTFTNCLYSLSICCLIFSLREKNMKSNVLLTKIGDYSFGMYLSHFLVLLIVKKISSLITLNYYINIIVIFSFTLLATYLSNKIYYEKVREKIWKK